LQLRRLHGACAGRLGARAVGRAAARCAIV